MSSKGRVIAAIRAPCGGSAQYKNKSFKRSVALVGSQHTQYILCGRQASGHGAMKYKDVITNDE